MTDRLRACSQSGPWLVNDALSVLERMLDDPEGYGGKVNDPVCYTER